ncbi:integrase catalytic domain-containing protein [Trichonephila clavipes]|nr:integrase catalytic domain-containing protein [Trichonephila clavipes]
MVMRNAATGRSKTDLPALYDELEAKIRALESLGRTQDNYGEFLSPLVESCLPEDILLAFERSTNFKEDAPGESRSLKLLMNFLKQEVKNDEMVELAWNNFSASVNQKKKEVNKPDKFPSAATLVSTHDRNGTVVGVDLAGLLYIKRGDKVWIVLYTCAIYRTLHLELVSSLSIDAFLLFFRRFVARRRRPRIIYSDNGTNFRGAYNELGDIDWNEVSRYAEIQRITWKFIPLTAAWWGGFWERLVRTVKELLRRTLQKAIFTAKVIKELKRRFRNEYLGQLIQRQKQHPQSSNIEVGDIVLIGDDWIKRLQWPFARVIKLIPGKDDCGNDITNPPLQKVQQTDLSVSCPRPDILKATEQPQVTRYGRPVKKPDKLNLLTLTDIFH